MAPYYLCELMSPKHQVPVSRLKSWYGDCVFSVAAPTLWNRLPANIIKRRFLNFLSPMLYLLFLM